MGAVGWGMGSQTDFHRTWWVSLSLTVVSVLPSTTHSNFSSSGGEWAVSTSAERTGCARPPSGGSLPAESGPLSCNRVSISSLFSTKLFVCHKQHGDLPSLTLTSYKHLFSFMCVFFLFFCFISIPRSMWDLSS